MSQFNFHKNYPYKDPPPNGNLLIITKLIATYKLWNEFRNHFPKKFRYVLVEKIESLFIKIIELIFTAARTEKQRKLLSLNNASNNLDVLKFFLQISWDLKALDNKKFIDLSQLLNEIGKMLGGWIKNLEKQTPPNNGRE